MSKVQVHVGDTLDEIGRRVLDAVGRMEAGEEVRERHIGFESWETMVRVISPKRLELLRHLHAAPVRSVRALATSLGRDYKNVHEDVEALAAAGLLDRDTDGIRADYDALDLRLSVAL